MSAAVAITAIVSGRAVELAGILTGGWLIRAAIPQLRMSAPKGNGNGAQDGPKP
jgi:hypothetical protein